MKNIFANLVLLFAALLFSINMNAQQQPQKPAAKKITEQGNKGDLILSKEIQKKQLNEPYTKVQEQNPGCSKKQNATGKNKKKKKG